MNRLAFGGEAEARLVDRLRAEGWWWSPWWRWKPARWLAIYCSAAAWQRRGIGSALVRWLRGPCSGDACRALELVTGALEAGGTLRYPDAFPEVS